MQTTLFEALEKDVKIHKALSYKGLYALHKYWEKKSFNIIRDFIHANTQDNEIVLDPFCGSGVTISEAVFAGRKGLGVDINPSSIFITRNLIRSINPKSLDDAFQKIEGKAKDKINSFYLVSHNGNNFIGKNYLWEKGNLSEIRYSNGTRKNVHIPPQLTDIKLANSFTYHDIEEFYPQDTLFYNSRINAKKGQKVYELFTPRNLKALSILFKEIHEIHDESIREMLRFCFTSALGQASKMVFVIKRRNKTKGIVIKDKKEVGSWVIGYWQPKDFFENNVWNCFENRYKKLLKAKKEQFKFKKTYLVTDNLTDIFTDVNYVLSNTPCQSSLKKLPDNSIDYILTDPPHSNRIPYLELSMLWNSWLKKEVNYQDEIIISEAKDRNKDVKDYTKRLRETIAECYRVLKPKRKFSLMFNSLDDKSWWEIMNIFNDIGFSLSKIEAMGYSANSVVQDNRKNSLKTDFIITYNKPINKAIKKLAFLSSDELEILIRDFIKENPHPETYQIINYVLCKSLRKNMFIAPASIIEKAKQLTKI